MFLADCNARTTLGLVADTWSVVVAQPNVVGVTPRSCRSSFRTS
ncbi:hypothetical protein ACIBG4_25295 [Nonomuraea sp. NPDC050383]